MMMMMADLNVAFR